MATLPVRLQEAVAVAVEQAVGKAVKEAVECVLAQTLLNRDLQEQLGLRQPTASHHLRKLVRAGILVREQRGPYGYHRVAPGALEDLCRVLGGA